MTETITSFRNEYAFLSNFYTCKIHYMGLDFSSVECAFQAAKCADPVHRVQFQYVTARDAKELGRKVRIRPDWEKVKADILLELLFIKFGTDADLLKLLLSTGESELVEGNTWHDNFWGDCSCGRASCDAEGQNTLGKLLMSVRSTYKHHRLSAMPALAQVKEVVSGPQ